MSRNVTVFSLTPEEYRAYRAVCKKYRHAAEAGRAIFAAGLKASQAAPAVDVTLEGRAETPETAPASRPRRRKKTRRSGSNGNAPASRSNAPSSSHTEGSE